MSWFGQQFEPAAACHVTEQYANNPVEADHGHFKARLRLIRVLKRFSSAQVISTVHAFVQNLMSPYPDRWLVQNRACELLAEIVASGAVDC